MQKLCGYPTEMISRKVLLWPVLKIKSMLEKKSNSDTRIGYLFSTGQEYVKIKPNRMSIQWSSRLRDATWDYCNFYFNFTELFDFEKYMYLQL